MPRDLFGDVTRPSISIGNRKWYTVPVSLLSHAAIVLMIVIVPLLAAPMMPGVLDSIGPVTVVDLVPPPPPPPPERRPAELEPAADPDVPPIAAPTGIAKEPDRVFEPSTTPVNVIGGADNIESVLAAPPVVVAPPKPQEPVIVGGTIRRPAKVRGNDPVYPPIAQAARVQGIVIIEATLDAGGRVTNARILRSVPLLDQAALEAVHSWEYTPTLLNGVPVPVIMTVTVTFTLSR